MALSKKPIKNHLKGIEKVHKRGINLNFKYDITLYLIVQNEL